mmetsp:Transcript_3756/g.17290  ORF Transcript_3756/g.17290 Transcript_3756/m.17290 type:complete len:200 (-) Transcript_3756:952-1551(-)
MSWFVGNAPGCTTRGGTSRRPRRSSTSRRWPNRLGRGIVFSRGSVCSSSQTRRRSSAVTGTRFTLARRTWTRVADARGRLTSGPVTRAILSARGISGTRLCTIATSRYSRLGWSGVARFASRSPSARELRAETPCEGSRSRSPCGTSSRGRCDRFVDPCSSTSSHSSSRSSGVGFGTAGDSSDPGPPPPRRRSDSRWPD